MDKYHEKGVFLLLNEVIQNGFMEDGMIKIDVIRKIDDLAYKINQSKISNSSIRKIYDNFKDIELKINKQALKKVSKNEQVDFDEEEKKAFEGIKVEISLMKSKVNYMIERKIENEKNYKSKEAYRNLREFLFTCLRQINTKDDFKGFLDIFMCIIGYMKGGEK